MANPPTIPSGAFVADEATTQPNVTIPTITKSKFDSGKYTQQKYNEIYHDVDLYLDNSGNFDAPRRYFINPAAVLGLHMSDTVNDWVVDGHLTFMYLPGGVEGLVKAKTGSASETPIDGVTKAAAENADALESYLFRGDGFDLLRVMIMPKSVVSDGPVGKGGLTITKNDTKWMLSYLFSIYDVEDVNEIPELQGITSTYMKCLRLKFHDVRYQMLQTTNLEYSSALPKSSKFVPNFQSDIAYGSGVLHTGNMLKDIFNEALANPLLGGCNEFEIKDSDPWDKGKSELFYTSPAQYSAADDISYVYSHHVSEKKLEGGVEADYYDMCVLHTDRAEKFGLLEKIALTPMSEFFEKAGKDKPGDLQKEHFFVTSNTEEKTATSFYRAPIGGEGKNIDLKTSKYGQIMSYSFVDMSAAINSNMFCSTPVYSVDIGNREFNTEFRGNDIISARRMIANSYISKLFKAGTDNEKLFLPTIHKNKGDINIFPTFSLNGTNPTVRQKNGLHQLLYTGVFQNACICFKVYGLTFRESGTFIGIDKSEGCADNDYNNKLYGQWFVVKVDHIFEAGAYVNLIYAVKVHRYKEQETKFEGTLDDEPLNQN